MRWAGRAGRGLAGGAALLVAGCVAYDPVPPSAYSRPVAPAYVPPAYELPPPVQAPPVVAEPLAPPPESVEPPLAAAPGSAPAGDVPPAPDAAGPARTEAGPPASGDPVTDLLLTPLPQRDAAQPTPPKAPTAAQDPFQGFRPMRGQTRPTP